MSNIYREKYPISPGVYNAELFKRKNGEEVIKLENVPGYTNAELHVGNHASDVNGCFGVGKTKGVDSVGLSVNGANSQSSLKKILDIIKADKSNDITVIVNGTNMPSHDLATQMWNNYLTTGQP